MIEVSYKTKHDGEIALVSVLRGSGGNKSSVSNLYEFDLMKDKKIDLHSSLSIASLSAAKYLLKMMKEAEIDGNSERML